MAEFMLVAMDQVVNEANRFHYMTAGQVKVPIVLKAGYGFTAGWAGQHTGTIYGMFMGVPGLKVALPATPADAKGLMTASIRDDNPVVFFHHYLLTLEHGDVPEGEHVVPLGQANVVREGSDVTIVALGYMLGQALEAAEQLAAEGVQAEVIDPRTLAPLDMATILTSVEKTGRLVVADQSTRHGSAAAVIAAEVGLGGLLLAEGADPARLRARRDDPVQRADGAVPPARRGEDRRGGARPGAGPGIERAQLLRAMWRIRAFEERVGQLARANEIPGLVHLSTGQEAVAVGVCSQLRDDDVVYSGHRAHGHALAKGAPMGPLMAELMGRDTGLCRGLGGSMHVVDREHGFLGATGVVGGNVPLALGSALAARLSGSDAVAVVFFGDGAVQGGIFVESVNLAALWKLPAILVCENNGFAEFTPRSAHTVVERVADVVAPYGFPRKTVDGNDVHAVRKAFGGFLRKARQGEGPFLLECLTHRLGGHYEGDPQRYREALGDEEWRAIDPILRLGGDEGLEEEARAEVEEAVEFARTSPFPPADLTTRLVYA